MRSITQNGRSAGCGRLVWVIQPEADLHGHLDVSDVAVLQVTAVLDFLKDVARAYPDHDLHLVMDNYASHKHPAVKKWLAANPRIVCHFTPTHAS